ncbi:hypothetical protein GCM10023084_15690 [Streptomyces lacrimifluminis]|uniref:DUF8175 domain-containing protein n=1 Tax=Streptomyces lacrimifluminis TaxID=1500077 RepID=A0A917KAW8_9ACTN|nr:hypothetical protein [Streptomyces lacrimifluminis]GGJ07343.1 hypothetical protein GCM10012282_00060 [Streptomyces lacrimifluminis]
MSLGDSQSDGDSTRPDDGGYGGTGQTRTRYHDQGNGGVYGGAQRTKSSRGTVTAVGVVVLLIAAIAFANRGGDDSSASSSSSTAGSGSGSDSADGPAAAPTAASGEQPVTKKAAGIPSGFAHNRQGVQSAAANYAVSLGSTGMFRKDSRDKLVDTLFTAEAAAKLKAPLDKAYSASLLTRLGLDAGGNAPEGSTFVSRVTPVGTKTVAYGGTTATVEVWYVGLSGIAGETSTSPVTSSWNTWTYDMRWSGGDWKIVSYSEKDGPNPVPGDDRAAASDEISKAIDEYGGFTYAR